MKPLPSLSDWFRGLSPRERIVVSSGAAIAGAAMLFSFVALPLSDRWLAREAEHAATLERWSRLQSLVSGEGDLRRALASRRRELRGTTSLLLSGGTPALAASGLQALLQRYADESFVQLNRVDVAGQPKPEMPGLLAVPVTLQGQGDIYGLVDFLTRIQHGDRLIVIDELTVGPRSSWARGDQPLVWTMRARGVYPAGGRT